MVQRFEPASECTSACRDSSAAARAPGWVAGLRPRSPSTPPNHRCCDRHRPAVPDEAVAAGRDVRRGRTRHPAPPAGAHRRPVDQPFGLLDPACLPNLALAIRIRRGAFKPRRGHPLTSGPLTQQPQDGANHRWVRTERHRTTRGVAALPGAPTSTSPTFIRSPHGRTRTQVKFLGQVSQAS